MSRLPLMRLSTSEAIEREADRILVNYTRAQLEAMAAGGYDAARDVRLALALRAPRIVEVEDHPHTEDANTNEEREREAHDDRLSELLREAVDIIEAHASGFDVWLEAAHAEVG